MDRRVAILCLLALGCAPVPPKVTPASEVRFASLSDDRFAYFERGRGEPVIFVHGGFQDYRMWLPFLPGLAAEYRVIAYSRRNHFPNATSRTGTADAASDRHADDLAALIGKLELGPAHIVGHSSGALTALFLAARHPRLVRSLVLVEPPAATLLGPSAPDQAALNDFGGRFRKALDALRRKDDPAAVRLFADAVGGPGTYDRRPPAQKRMMLDNVGAHAADAELTSRPQFTCEMAKGISAPALLINGTRSPAFFHRIADRLAACLPNDRRIAIESSHTVPGENPGKFAAAVQSFLDQQKAE